MDNVDVVINQWSFGRYCSMEVVQNTSLTEINLKKSVGRWRKIICKVINFWIYFSLSVTLFISAQHPDLYSSVRDKSSAKIDFCLSSCWQKGRAGRKGIKLKLKPKQTQSLQTPDKLLQKRVTWLKIFFNWNSLLKRFLWQWWQKRL